MFPSPPQTRRQVSTTGYTGLHRSDFCNRVADKRLMILVKKLATRTTVFHEVWRLFLLYCRTHCMEQLPDLELCADVIVSAAARRSISVGGGGAPPVQKNRRRRRRGAA